MDLNDRNPALKIDFLWYPECPSHPQAREMLKDVLRELDVEAEITERHPKLVSAPWEDVAGE